MTGSNRTTTSRYDSPPKRQNSLSVSCFRHLLDGILASVTVIKFVFVTIGEVIRIGLLDHKKLSNWLRSQYTHCIPRFPGRCQRTSCDKILREGKYLIRHSIAYTSIQLVQRLPGQFRIRERLGSLNGTFQGGSPHLRMELSGVE